MTKPSAQESPQRQAVKESVRLSLNEKLALINLIDEGVRLGSANSPLVADLFHDLGDLYTLPFPAQQLTGSSQITPAAGSKSWRSMRNQVKTWAGSICCT